MILKPDWQHWVNMVEVPLKDAVWLSLDVEPCDAVAAADRISDVNRGIAFARLKRSAARRLEVAETHITGLLEAISWHPSEPRKNWTVSLAAFRQWGSGLPAPLSFPPEFPGGNNAKSQRLDVSRYPEELKAAIEAFEALQDSAKQSRGRHPKQLLRAWLDANKSHLSGNARERIATVANWQPAGGAPKTPG